MKRTQTLKGLLYKEWKMMRFFLIGMLVITVGIMVFFPAVSRNPMNGLVELFVIGVVVTPLSLLFSLNMETNQLQHFLHNPQSAHQLIGAKVLYSVAIMAVYMLIPIILITIGNLLYDYFILSWGEIFLFLVSNTLILMVYSLFIAGILLLLWSIHQVLKAYVRGISILFTLGILFVGMELNNLLINTEFYETINHIGEFNILLETKQNSIDFFGISFSLGSIIFWSVITCIFYTISIYLIERKLEVS